MENRKLVVVKDVHGERYSLSVELVNGTPRFVRRGLPMDITFPDDKVMLTVEDDHFQIVLASYVGARQDDWLINGKQVRTVKVDGLAYASSISHHCAYLAADETACYVPQGISTYLCLTAKAPGIRYIGSTAEVEDDRELREDRCDVLAFDLGSSLETGAIHDARGVPALVRTAKHYVVYPAMRRFAPGQG